MRKQKKLMKVNYTSETDPKTNPVMTKLTQRKTPHPNKILKNKSDINPKSGFMHRIYAK